MTNENGRHLQVPGPGVELPADKSLKLTQNDVLDLSGLSESQVSELRLQHAKGLVSLQQKAQEMKIDVAALDASLSSFNDQTAKATQAGTSATIQHSQTTSIGRTEVIVGNTDRAAAGKLSRSAAGEKDRTLIIIGIIAVAVVLVAMFMGGK
ncbi:hypothetical protein KS461_11010 [Pseudomonas chlororaphis]|uniref:hypothetical protein n=1 Tax=Pseudomonas chlororaphis TaxID=587753 RepID=UPI0006A59836|nr:hypothetical protein [Pseudomonas chlororaphis]UVE47772.1 hypothetical protein KS461_11010 [Pseudomonas chlororaphis]